MKNDELPVAKLPREGELFDQKYRVGRVLGIGGMAAVIAARHLGLDEMVAIKVLLPECCDDPAVVERFVQEGKTAIKIRSEHVVRMLDVGIASGRAYLVMEHLVGKDLEALVRDGGPLPVEVAVDFLLQACEAIGEAHALGIVHRDLKPANLFLTHRVDGAPCVKVLDFGISKMPRKVSLTHAGGSQPTLAAIIMGSPQYMAPEQMVSAAAADARSDIWSLGAVLYELLTGQLAFGGGSTAEVCARVLQGEPVPLGELRADLPADLLLVVARTFEKNPARRYPNVSQLAQALAPFGTSDARTSAISISRVFDGGIEERPAATSAIGTIKPTAASILLGAVRIHRSRTGYLVGALAAVAAAAAVAVALGHADASHVSSGAAVPDIVAPAPPELAPPPLPSAEPPASHASVEPAPSKHSHPASHPATRHAGANPLDASTEGAGPYDAP